MSLVPFRTPRWPDFVISRVGFISELSFTLSPIFEYQSKDCLIKLFLRCNGGNFEIMVLLLNGMQYGSNRKPRFAMHVVYAQSSRDQVKTITPGFTRG